MGEDCFEIKGKWYAYNSKLITLDHETKKYVLVKETPLVYGVVSFKADGSPVFGYFTENKYSNILVNVNGYGNVQTLNEKTLLDGGYIENLSDGVWYYKKNLSAAQITHFSRIETHKVWTNKGYNIEDNADEFKEKIESYEKFPLRIPAMAMRYGKMLGETSFGLEIETIRGYIPEYIQSRLGLVICRDGSIENAEYVTVPMRGAKGIVNIKEMGKEFCKRTLTNHTCSFHIHLGTLPSDRIFIVSLYALALRIQDEIFTMFPYYKTEWKGVKRQNYNQKLRRLGTGMLKPEMNKEQFTQYVDEAYYRIFTWLNDGVPPDDNFNRVTNNHQHTAKWNRKQR
jgi:hypothetical protein